MADNYVSQFDLRGLGIEADPIKVKDAELRKVVEEKNTEVDLALTSLDERVNALETAPAAEGVTAKMFDGRALLFCADSYGAARSEFKQFPELIKQSLQGIAPVVNISKGSQGFSGGNGGTHLQNFTSREPEFKTLFEAAGMAEYSAEKITDIFFGCGHNDTTQTGSAVTSAINSLYDYVSVKYPNATIWVIFASTDESLTDLGDAYNGTTVRSKTYDNVYVPYSQCGDNPRMRFMDCTGVFMDRKTLMRDYVHPNAQGSKILARTIMGLLTGAVCKPIFRAEFTGDTSVIESPTSFTIDTSVQNGNIVATISGASFFKFVNPIKSSGTENVYVKVATRKNGSCLWTQQPSGKNPSNWPAFTAVMRSSTQQYAAGTILFNIDSNGDLQISIAPARSGMQSTGVGVIYLGQIPLVLDCFK